MSKNKPATIGEQIMGEQNKKDFVILYGEILRMRNILDTFDEFVGNEILTERDMQDYHGTYIDSYQELRKTKETDKENINDDLVFEMELIKQIEINIDYILTLVKKHYEKHTKINKVLTDINRAIDSSIELRNKKDLINQFVASLDSSVSIDEKWHEFVKKSKIKELKKIISDENLNQKATYKFMQNAFRDGNVAISGTSITEVLPPVSRFSKSGERTKKLDTVIKKFTQFFKRFFDISNAQI